MILFTMYSDQIGTNLASAAGVRVVLPKLDGLPVLIKALDSFLGDGAASAPAIRSTRDALNTQTSRMIA